MHVDQFEMRLAIVRHRFATTLGSKIEDALISANHMSKGDAGVNKCISESYRSLHGICGIGPTVGSSPVEQFTVKIARKAAKSLQRFE